MIEIIVAGALILFFGYKIFRRHRAPDDALPQDSIEMTTDPMEVEEEWFAECVEIKPKTC